MSDAFITVENIKRRYIMGDTIVRALDGVSFTVEQGEYLCLMGPSGSGKSTLLNLLGGLDTADEGTIVVGKQTITTLDENALAIYRRKTVGFVFQGFNLIPTMTAMQNVAFPMVFAGVNLADREARAAKLLTAVGLGDRLDHKPTELSGGQQQRVALARALVNKPAILLGDEPTGNLDTKTGEQILDVLGRLNESGQTVILVTHDPRITARSTRTIHMLDGTIVEEVTL